MGSKLLAKDAKHGFAVPEFCIISVIGWLFTTNRVYQDSFY
jgi:hypothetical protein